MSALKKSRFWLRWEERSGRSPRVIQNLYAAGLTGLAGHSKSARIAMADARCFGIFGTSIAGMWLYGSLSNRIEFFVDEDVSRVGGHYEGRPIISPDDVPDGATIFVPMGHKAAEALIARLAVGGSQAEWILPPTEIV